MRRKFEVPYIQIFLTSASHRRGHLLFEVPYIPIFLTSASHRRGHLLYSCTAATAVSVLRINTDTSTHLHPAQPVSTPMPPTETTSLVANHETETQALHIQQGVIWPRNEPQRTRGRKKRCKPAGTPDYMQQKELCKSMMALAAKAPRALGDNLLGIRVRVCCSIDRIIAPVAYQVILEPGVGQFREFESPRVHARRVV